VTSASRLLRLAGDRAVLRPENRVVRGWCQWVVRLDPAGTAK